jgi:hypothetical protein
MAKLILKEEVNRMGGAVQLEELVVNVTQRIDTAKRAAFIADAQSILRAPHSPH